VFRLAGFCGRARVGTRRINYPERPQRNELDTGPSIERAKCQFRFGGERSLFVAIPDRTAAGSGIHSDSAADGRQDGGVGVAVPGSPG